MLFKLFLLFSIVPVIELAILIQIGGYIGIPYTMALVIGTAIIGAYMVRHEGLSVMYRFKQNMQTGQFPAEEILDGALILVAGALLLTPGILTDVIGFLLVFPLSRLYIKDFIKERIRININLRGIRRP
jgi:UPF0716 protein FxsA